MPVGAALQIACLPLCLLPAWLRSEEGRQLVEGWHGRYITALQQLWEENREQYGQPGVDMRLVE